MPIKKLHPAQQKLLTLLVQNVEDPLTVRELQEQINASSTSVVVHHLSQLEKRGYLKRNPYNPRDYQVLKGGPEKPVTYLNLYGLAHCGPRGSILDDSPVDRIAVASRLVTFPITEAFMVKAKGDSMSPKINEGDLIIAKRGKTATSGSMVVCVNDGEALIKIYKKDKRGVILSSLNQKYSPFLAASDFRIEGVVKSSYSYI